VVIDVVNTRSGCGTLGVTYWVWHYEQVGFFHYFPSS